MADDKTENEEHETEVDETAEKAKAIGKEIGAVAEEKPDDTPDYEIEEEPDAGEDVKLGKNREDKPAGEKKERKELSNREKRALRKKKINDKFNEKDAEIERLRSENLEIKRRQDETDNRLHGINKAEIEKAHRETVATFTNAEADHAAAFSEGDGAKATLAMRAMYDAQRKIEQLEGIYKQLEKLPPKETKEEPTPRQDPRIVSYAQDWGKKNPWYRKPGNEVDTAVALAVADVLVKEGYDPKSEDYWDELDDRLAERLPEKYAGDDDEEEEEEKPAPKKKRAGPPVGGGSPRGDTAGKKTIKLKTSYIDTLKANGIWDDVPRRNRVVKEYLRIRNESGN